MSNPLRTPQGEFPDPQTVTLVEHAWEIFAAVHQQMTAVFIATDMMIRSSHVSVRAIQDVMLSNAMAAELHDTAGKFFARIKELLAIELEARSESTRGYLFPADEDGAYSREGGRR